MADTVGYFQIVNPQNQEWLGGYTAKDASEIRSGTLVKINSSGQLDRCVADDAPDGFGWTNRTLVYSPESVYAAADEPVTLVRGANLRFLADARQFIAGALPSYGAQLYTAAEGKMATTGAASGYFGKVIGSDTIRAIPNTTASVVLCEAQFTLK